MASPQWDEKRGRWRIRAIKDGKDTNFLSKKKGIQGKKEVLKKYNEWLLNDEPLEATVNVVWDEFIKSYLDRHGECEQYKKIIRLSIHILPAIGNKKIRSLKLKDWQGLISNAKPISAGKETLSKKSLSNIRGVINQFISFAVANDYMEPLKAPLYIPEGRPTIGKEILQPNEIAQIFAKTEQNESQWYINYFRFLLCTGLRPSEAMGLRWDSIDPITKVVTISQAVNYSNKITKGKNKNARRQFRLTELAENILSDQRARTEKLRSDWIFCNRIGGLGNQEQAAKEYSRITATFASKTTPYCLRHTFITIMSPALPDSILKKIVGHSEYMSTFDTYGSHQLNGEKEIAAQTIESTINKIVANS